MELWGQIYVFKTFIAFISVSLSSHYQHRASSSINNNQQVSKEGQKCEKGFAGAKDDRIFGGERSDSKN